MKTVRPAVWFEIYVDHIDRAQQFYEELLDVKLEDLTNPTTQLMQMKSFPENIERYGCNGALVQMEGVKAGGNSTIIYFHSDDCRVEEHRFTKAGGTVFKPKMSIGQYGFIVLGMDTEGNMIGIHSMS